MNLAALTDGKFKKYLPFIVIGMGAGAIALFNRQRSNVSTDETSNISTGEIDGKLTEMQSNFNEALQQNAEAMQGNFDDLLLQQKAAYDEQIVSVKQQYENDMGTLSTVLSGVQNLNNQLTFEKSYLEGRINIIESTISSQASQQQLTDKTVSSTQAYNIPEIPSATKENIELQKALQRAGQNWLPVTGELDQNTRIAIKQFKDSEGLKDNIGAGAMTKDAQAALKPFYSETSNTIKSSTSSNSDVIELQKALQKAGQKWLPVTGELDENTRKAIKQFKDSKGLKDNIGAGAMTKEAQTVLKQYYM